MSSTTSSAVRSATDLGACPPPSEWPAVLRWWIMREYALSRFHSWHSTAEVWHDLLRDTRNGVRVGYSRPNPHGLSISATPDEVYPLALAAARHWKALGSPIERVLREGTWT